ncbi:MAG: acyl-CoA synthetase [Spirochaetes bacterium DG_61]|nr:MAG: acyl-CoA synthetase [Spirochaetes bacterium DG_61]
MKGKWRLIFNPEGDAADLLAYPSALVEGRIAGKYLLTRDQLPDTIVVQGVKKKGILAGADVQVDRESAQKNDVEVATYPRSGRGGAKLADTVSFQEIMVKSSRNFSAEEVNPEETAVLLYTSGTTGKPKGVKLSHNNFLAECELTSHVFPLEPEDKVIGVLPFFHVYAMADVLVPSIYFGCSMSLVPQYSPMELLKNISDVGATVLIAIPSMYIHLLQISRSRKATIPKSLRACISGGAPLPIEVIKEFEEAFQTRIAEGYGLTESTACVCLNQSGERFKVGSIGPPGPGVEMNIFDDEDKELPPGQVGEVVIRGGVITDGYWNAPDETEEAMKGGWFHTGDLGYRDAEGYFYITDRKKDIIIRGGFNISPREVEEVLYTHHKVREAAVVGVPDKGMKEAVKAFVVLKDGESAAPKEIVEFCKEHLSPFKVPKFLEFRESLPKSATGKVLRKELKEGYKDERLIEESGEEV